MDQFDQALMHLVELDLISFGVNEEGEFVFWMSDEQKKQYDEDMGTV